LKSTNSLEGSAVQQADARSRVRAGWWPEH